MTKDLDELKKLEEMWRITGLDQSDKERGFTVVLTNRLSGEAKYFYSNDSECRSYVSKRLRGIWRK